MLNLLFSYIHLLSSLPFQTLGMSMSNRGRWMWVFQSICHLKQLSWPALGMDQPWYNQTHGPPRFYPGIPQPPATCSTVAQVGSTVAQVSRLCMKQHCFLHVLQNLTEMDEAIVWITAFLPPLLCKSAFLYIFDRGLLLQFYHTFGIRGDDTFRCLENITPTQIFIFVVFFLPAKTRMILSVDGLKNFSFMLSSHYS